MFPQMQTRSKTRKISDPTAQAARLASNRHAAIGATLAELWCNLRRWREKRRAALLLRELDDHTLRDIGIHRCEIESVLNASIYE
jgi:uncharacterized protein YjiS (DUF1127 family)